MPKLNTPEQAVMSTILTSLKSKRNSLVRKRERITAEITALEAQIETMTSVPETPNGAVQSIESLVTVPEADTDDAA